MASKRLKDIVSHLTSSPSQEKQLPKFDDLPWFKEYPGCAWGVWGPDDELGTVNLLTDDVVRRASQEEIKLGKTVSLNWYAGPLSSTCVEGSEMLIRSSSRTPPITGPSTFLNMSASLHSLVYN